MEVAPSRVRCSLLKAGSCRLFYPDAEAEQRLRVSLSQALITTRVTHRIRVGAARTIGPSDDVILESP